MKLDQRSHLPSSDSARSLGVPGSPRRRLSWRGGLLTGGMFALNRPGGATLEQRASVWDERRDERSPNGCGCVSVLLLSPLAASEPARSAAGFCWAGCLPASPVG